MDETELNKLKRFRDIYDHALSVCDPIDYAMRQRDLLYAIAEFIVQPLQEHELAERSKFRDEDETEPS